MLLHGWKRGGLLRVSNTDDQVHDAGIGADSDVTNHQPVIDPLLYWELIESRRIQPELVGNVSADMLPSAYQKWNHHRVQLPVTCEHFLN